MAHPEEQPVIRRRRHSDGEIEYTMEMRRPRFLWLRGLPSRLKRTRHRHRQRALSPLEGFGLHLLALLGVVCIVTALILWFSPSWFDVDSNRRDVATPGTSVRTSQVVTDAPTTDARVTTSMPSAALSTARSEARSPIPELIDPGKPPEATSLPPPVVPVPTPEPTAVPSAVPTTPPPASSTTTVPPTSPTTEPPTSEPPATTDPPLQGIIVQLFTLGSQP